MKNYNDIMRELANYTRMREDMDAIIDGLKDELKTYMTENGVEILNGDEHKATYKLVASSRLDSAALKKELPEVAARYTKRTETMRFTFA